MPKHDVPVPFGHEHGPGWAVARLINEAVAQDPALDIDAAYDAACRVRQRLWQIAIGKDHGS